MPFSLIEERFRVSCLPRAQEVATAWNATHVISLLDPELDDVHIPVISSAEHIVARLRDQENSAATVHFPDLIASLFETVRPAVENTQSRILVHCHAGVSRSTAMAYAMIAHRGGPGTEDEAFAALLRIVNKPWPNRRVIEILDQYLDRKGALLAPLDAMRARYPARIEAWHRFNKKRGLFDLYAQYER